MSLVLEKRKPEYANKCKEPAPRGQKKNANN
jgi:hypothetical protein